MSEPYISPSQDTRPVNELVNMALNADKSAPRYRAIAALHFRGTREVFEIARRLISSADAQERSVGASILGGLGIPQRSFPEEQFQLLVDLLEDEQSHDVLSSLCVALGEMGDPRAIPHILPLKGFPDVNVRHAAAFALRTWETDETIQTIIELTHDDDPKVRDVATFILGTEYNEDTPTIRATLFARYEDEDEGVRFQSLVGLAKRTDHRIVNKLVDYMVTGKYSSYWELCKGLHAMRDQYTGDPEKLKIAMSYCSEEDK